MSRKADADRLKELQNAIQNHPGNRSSFFARLLGWRREEVSRGLTTMDDEGILLSEDDEGRLWPYDPTEADP
ncbi:MAG: hypothetical protein ACT4QE_21215 [Anaerolineales bacterium]